jgi:hypothetical protein
MEPIVLLEAKAASACARSCTCPFLGTLSESLMSWHSYCSRLGGCAVFKLPMPRFGAMRLDGDSESRAAAGCHCHAGPRECHCQWRSRPSVEDLVGPNWPSSKPGPGGPTSGCRWQLEPDSGPPSHGQGWPPGPPSGGPPPAQGRPPAKPESPTTARGWQRAGGGARLRARRPVRALAAQCTAAAAAVRGEHPWPRVIGGPYRGSPRGRSSRGASQ